MKRLKSLLLLLLALPSSMPLTAQDATTVQKLVISKYDGTEVSLLLSEKPKISFGGYCVNMDIATTNETVYLNTRELDKMIVVSVEDTKIDHVIVNANTTFTLQGDVLLIDVLSTNSKITVFGVDGKVYLSQELTAGTHALPLSDLPKGVCVVKVNNETFKIQSR